MIEVASDMAGMVFISTAATDRSRDNVTKDRRFRGFSLAQVESVQLLEDGSVSVLGVSGSGDAVALTVHPAALDELLAGLEFPLPPQREAS